MPYKHPAIKVDLAEIEQDGFWLEVEDLRWLSKAQREERFGAIEDDEERGRAVISQSIIAWNLEDAATGELLRVPREDAEAMDRLPGAIARYIAERVMGLASAPLSARTKATP